MPIFWRPQLSIGHPELDADHRYLMLLINTVELVLRFPEKPQDVLLAFDELARYAREHFEREERVQISCHYVGYDRHKAEHRELLQSLAALRVRVEQAIARSAEEPAALTSQSAEITAFLRHWLIDHVMKADMKLAELFRRQPT